MDGRRDGWTNGWMARRTSTDGLGWADEDNGEDDDDDELMLALAPRLMLWMARCGMVWCGVAWCEVWWCDAAS